MNNAVKSTPSPLLPLDKQDVFEVLLNKRNLNCKLVTPEEAETLLYYAEAIVVKFGRPALKPLDRIELAKIIGKWSGSGNDYSCLMDDICSKFGTKSVSEESK